MGYVNDIYVSSGGGGGASPTGTGSYLVRTLDIDGTVIKQEYVNWGENATPPTHPTHEYLIANGYTHSYDNIQKDTDIGLLYSTVDNKAYLFMRFTNTTGLKPTIRITKEDTSLMTVTWGDGTSQDTSASGNVAITKTNPYATIGDYIVTIECESNWNYSANYIFNNDANYNSCLLKLYLSDNCTQVGQYSFNFLSSLEVLSLPSGITGFCGANGVKRLKVLILPTGITGFTAAGGTSIETIVISNDDLIIPRAAVYSDNGAALRYITIPENATSIAEFTFYRCYCLQSKIVLPYAIITVEDYAFSICQAMLHYEILPTTPPTLVNTNAFSSINKACKFYVPDASLTDYQGATNWVTYANYFYPISQLAKWNGTIFFQCNGGTAVKQIRGTIGSIATEPTAPTKAGFTFDGWYKEEALTTAWNWATDVYPANNLTLYAKWI